MNPPCVERGALASICLPIGLQDFGRARGYLAAGDCPGGSSPVLKQIVALSGDEVEVGEDYFAVTAQPLDRASLRHSDSLGRPLGHVELGRHRVRDGEVWVLGVHRERSWDSRYFGPLPIASIRARAKPLLVLDGWDD